MKKSALLAATLVVMAAQAQSAAAIMSPHTTGGIEQELTALNEALLRDLAIDVSQNTPRINRVVIGTGHDDEALSGARLSALENEAIRRLTNQVTVEELGGIAASGFSSETLAAELRRANAELSRQLSVTFTVGFYLDHEARETARNLNQACAC